MKYILPLLLAAPLFAQDAGALYKSRCAACHGPDGKGKPAIAGTNLLSPEAKKLTDAEMKTAIADGGKKAKAAHAYGKKGINEKQVEGLIAFVRDLQKK